MASVVTAPSPPNAYNSHASTSGNAVLSSKPALDSASSSKSLNGSGVPPAPVTRRIRRKQPKTIAEDIRTWVFDHQIRICSYILIFHALVHTLVPRARHVTGPFFQLSYPDHQSGLYRRGIDDLYFVAYWIVALTGLRAACMLYCLQPIAMAMGIQKPKLLIRFSEQAWLMVYYSASFALGMYIMYHRSYWMNFRELWTNFPTLEITGTFKLYYLMQMAFWLQQIVVVHIEERRKDFSQMLTHHIITSLLIFFSYGYYQQKVGNVILCIMDGVDIALALAKVLNYARWQMACDTVFAVFILSWFLARHVLYLFLCWSVQFDVMELMHYGCYSSETGEMLRLSPSDSDAPGGTSILREVTQPYFNPGGEFCYNYQIRYTFLGLLLALQGITILWFVLILRVAYRVIAGKGAADNRSDSEATSEEEEEEKADVVKPLPISADNVQAIAGAVQPLEEYVGVEGLSFSNSRKASTVVRSRKPGSSTGLTAIGDKKEILNRIGCDTKST